MKAYYIKNLDNTYLFKSFIQKTFYRWTETFRICFWEVSQLSQIDYRPTAEWSSDWKFQYQ